MEPEEKKFISFPSYAEEIFKSIISFLPKDIANKLKQKLESENQSKKFIERILRMKIKEQPIFVPKEIFIQTVDWAGLVKILQEVNLYAANSDPEHLYQAVINTIILKDRIDLLSVLIDIYKDNLLWNDYMRITEVALAMAIQNNKLAAVKELIENGSVNPSNQSNLPLRVAVVFDGTHEAIINYLLLKIDPSANSPTHNYLLAIAKKGRYDIILKLLKDSRTDPSIGNNALLRKAREDRQEDIVKILLRDPRVLGLLGEMEEVESTISNSSYSP